jgi:hypothetical protein
LCWVITCHRIRILLKTVGKVLGNWSRQLTLFGRQSMRRNPYGGQAAEHFRLLGIYIHSLACRIHLRQKQLGGGMPRIDRRGVRIPTLRVSSFLSATR